MSSPIAPHPRATCAAVTIAWTAFVAIRHVYRNAQHVTVRYQEPVHQLLVLPILGASGALRPAMRIRYAGYRFAMVKRSRIVQDSLGPMNFALDRATSPHNRSSLARAMEPESAMRICARRARRTLVQQLQTMSA